MRTSRWVVVILGMLGAAAAAAQPVVIESGDCLGWAGWTPPGTPAGSVSGGEYPLGNPAPGCFISHSHPEVGSSQIDSSLLYAARPYSPSLEGVISRFDVEVDAFLSFAAGDVTVAFSFALRQDGRVFVLPAGGAPGLAWVKVRRTALTATDFDDPYLAGLQHPDFDVSGGAIEFGVHLRSVKSGGVVGSFILQLDNFRVEVSRLSGPPRVFFDVTNLVRGPTGSWNLLTPVAMDPEEFPPGTRVIMCPEPVLGLDRVSPIPVEVEVNVPLNFFGCLRQETTFPPGSRVATVEFEVHLSLREWHQATVSLRRVENAVQGDPRSIVAHTFDRALLDAPLEFGSCAYCAFQGVLRMIGFDSDPRCLEEPAGEAGRDSAGAAAPRAGADAPVATLRALRDQLMATTGAGRYYTRLYETLSPALVSAILKRPSIALDAMAAQGPWLDAFAAQLAGQGGSSVISQAMEDDLLAILARLAEAGGPELRRAIDFESGRLQLDALAGSTIDQFWNRVNAQGGPAPCAPGSEALCLRGNRFRVEADWQDPRGNVGVGRAVPLTADTGYFWFFNPANVEAIFKLHDGRSLNGHWWAFYGALSNVAYTLTVTDTETGRVHAYANPQGTLASVGDTRAFSGDAEAGGGVAEAASPATEESRLEPRGGTCAPSATALCLNAGRFRVSAAWRDFQGRTGVGQAVGLTADTGYLWFFRSTNVEVVAKVLDGRAVNGRFWFFYGALSNVEYTLTVEDTATGAVRTYANPSGRFASVADTSAF